MRDWERVKEQGSLWWANAAWGCSLMVALCLSFACDSDYGGQARQGLSDRVVQLLAQGDFSAVARLQHYPESYSERERAEDVGSVERGLRFLFGRTGRIDEWTRRKSSGKFYFVSVAGGDAPYWSRFEKRRLASVPFDVRLSDLGPGIVKVIVVVGDAGEVAGEVAEVQLGLAVEQDGARDVIVELTLGLLEEMGVAGASSMRSAIEAQLGDGKEI